MIFIDRDHVTFLHSFQIIVAKAMFGAEEKKETKPLLLRLILALRLHEDCQGTRECASAISAEIFAVGDDGAALGAFPNLRGPSVVASPAACLNA